jgi:hypothetical protein
MRTLRIAVIAAALAASVAGAQAERRMFIIASNADGYGVDRCLETAAHCGAAVAAAFCKARNFVTAAAYRKVNRDEITGSIPADNGGCHGGRCDEFVAITCSR